MNRVKKYSAPDFSTPAVVAAAHSVGGLRLAQRLGKADVDFIEVRVDALAGKLPEVRRFFANAGLPVLLTVRHPAEGGVGNLSVAERRALFHEFLPRAAVVDVELRSVRAMGDVISAAKSHGAAVVVSDHHFHGIPTLAQMRLRARRAFDAGADIFKLAARADDGRAVARLLDFVSSEKSRRLAVMGMGKLGQASRLVLACAGSVLNYGYLDKPNAPGQWEARELRRLLNPLLRPLK